MNRDALVRRWWSLFLDGAPIAKDGQVKGSRIAWDHMTEDARATCARYEHWTVAKIKRDNRDPDECITASVRACRQELQHTIHAQLPLPDPDAVRRIVATIIRGMA